MKKFILPVAVFGIMSALLGSCTGLSGNSDDDNDSIDSIDTVCADSDSLKLGVEQAVVGVVLDGAMNSVEIVTADGDTLNFGYPDLAQEKRVAWNVNDTLTVKFVKVNIDGELQDSVTSLSLGRE